MFPYRLVTGIWNDLLQRFPKALRINTHTPVEEIERAKSSMGDGSPGSGLRDSGWIYGIKTSMGHCRTRKVLHATNAYAPYLLPSLRPYLTGVIGHMSAQKPGELFPCKDGSISHSIIYPPGFDYVMQRPNGDLVIGGGHTRTEQRGLDQHGVWDDAREDLWPSVQIRGVVPSLFQPNWGAGGHVIKSWSGIMGFTGDDMPLVGRVASCADEWVCGGYNGMGMVWGWLCGAAVAVMVLGREEEVLEGGRGRPGGVLESWFPMETLGLGEKRLKRANLRNLLAELAGEA